MNTLPPSGLPSVVVARPLGPPPPQPEPLHLTELPRSSAAFHLVLIGLLLLGLPLVLDTGFGTLLEEASPPEGVQPSAKRFYTILIVRKWIDALLAVGLAGYLVMQTGVTAGGVGLRRKHLGRQFAWTIPALGATYTAFAVTAVLVWNLMPYVPGMEEDVRRRTELFALMPLDDALAGVLLMVPVAVHEEVLFRGLMLPHLRRVGCPWGVAILLSSAVFAVLHVTQGWVGVMQVFVLGLVFSSTFVITRSLLTVVSAHLLFNLIQLQVMRFVMQWQEQVERAA